MTNWQQYNVAVDPRRICRDHSKVELDFPVMTGTGMTGVPPVPDFFLNSRNRRGLVVHAVPVCEAGAVNGE